MPPKKPAVGVAGGAVRVLRGACCTAGALLALGAAYGVAALLLLSPIDPAPRLRLHDPPVLQPNRMLAGAEHVGAGDLIGPESMAAGTLRGRAVLYLALADGRIARLWHSDRGDPEWETVVRTGEVLSGCGRGGPGEKEAPEDVCGRPLGLRTARRGDIVAGGDPEEEVLVVCDAYKGLLMVSGLAGRAEVTVLARRAPGDPHDFRLLNDLVQAPDGSIYFTETSTEFQRRRIGYALFSGRPRGRLLRYRRGGGVEVVLPNITVPNGVTLAHGGEALLIVMEHAQVWRYDLAAGTLRKWAELPGTGDNIRTRHALPTGEPRRCYWGGLGSKYAQPFSLLAAVRDRPLLRQFIAAAVPYDWIVGLIPKYGMLGVWGEDGELIATYQDPSGRTPWVSEAEPFGGSVYLGSWLNGFLARVDPAQLAGS
eukprot:TRINITY_DN37833_c0_g1_i1.p1 TRINITY_DN37833_c0_g1~~TRINITY_DN37833_c0_g1_i1.p1  ORF type:complete len:425 (+),score=132.21 TRINITY_DN37833_c0_g1_i1:73-1347(+)